MDKDIALKVEHVAKSFKLPTEKSSGLKNSFINWTRGIKGYTRQRVLRDISFTVNKGDFFGIVGRNGSGKSTLLKLISQIYNPDSGSITVNGSLISFIELGVGFNPELTGRENVFLNGAMLGFSREQVEKMYKDIVDFAELHDFMDQKLKNYSSGMQVRLAFSVAIKAQGDILVLDEVLAVGDEAFQRKCSDFFASIKKDKTKTVVLVTHSMDAVQQFCNKAIMIEGGEITEQGDPAFVAQKYRELFMDQAEIGKKTGDATENKYVSVDVKTVKNAQTIKFNVAMVPKVDIEDAVITFVLARGDGDFIYRWVTDEKIRKHINLSKGKKAAFSIEIENILPDGVFDVQIGVKKRDRSENYAVFNNASEFEISHSGSHPNDAFWKLKCNINTDQL